MYDKDKVYYIYMWYLRSTGEVFYIGKGKNDRYKSMASRNPVFKNIMNKHKDEVDVMFFSRNLDEKTALDMERFLISEYHGIGQCRANIHEGGCGGNTGNYDSVERSRKLSEQAKARFQGKNNPMYGKTHSEEAIAKIRKANVGIPKVFTEEHKRHLAEANRKRAREMTEEERKMCSVAVYNRGLKKTPEEIDAMLDRICKYEYVVYFEGNRVFSCLGSKRLFKYCSETYGVSRSIVEKIMRGTWKPTFNRHKHLDTLRVEVIERCID